MKITKNKKGTYNLSNLSLKQIIAIEHACKTTLKPTRETFELRKSIERNTHYKKDTQ